MTYHAETPAAILPQFPPKCPALLNNFDCYFMARDCLRCVLPTCVHDSHTSPEIAWRRYSIIQLADAGIKLADICHMLNIHPRTASRALKGVTA